MSITSPVGRWYPGTVLGHAQIQSQRFTLYVSGDDHLALFATSAPARPVMLAMIRYDDDGNLLWKWSTKAYLRPVTRVSMNDTLHIAQHLEALWRHLVFGHRIPRWYRVTPAEARPRRQAELKRREFAAVAA